jgi:cellobiose phosphorylase
MDRHGRNLAGSHRLRKRAEADRLLARLSDNQAALDRTSRLLAEAANAGRRLAPAEEWLLDNIYVIREQVVIARRHLPRDYSRELPQLANGPSRGRPRVYDIAQNAISHGDGRVDLQSLSRFVAAYQSITPLTLGELWAIPIMLRLALIENLRRIAMRVYAERAHRTLADSWADRIVEVATADPKGLVLVVADMARSKPPQASAFVAEFARRLQGRTAALTMPLTWVEQWLADSGQSVEQMIHADGQQQAAAQVSVSNSIGSMRLLGTLDWRDFVETMSVVDLTLRLDPAGMYGAMDFSTRDRYRHATERLALMADRSEVDVASTALSLAQQRVGAADPLLHHVGYFLIDEGRDELEAALGMDGLAHRLRQAVSRLPLAAYTVPGLVIVAFCTWAMVSGALLPEASDQGWKWVAIALSIVAFSELAVSVINWAANLLVLPHSLPRLDFSTGVPSDARTIVVVPSLIGSVAAVEALAEALEIRFLANREDNVYFALLTDFPDAPTEHTVHDAEVVEAAGQAVDTLNERYCAADAGDRFFLFHRPRLWNPREGAWMGGERKRGKLAALNGFLRTGDVAPFAYIAGNTDLLRDIRYVITLDTDTQLPRDAARELIGTIAHPLNRPRFDLARRVVIRGYGILQPRVGISMSGQKSSRYSSLFGSEPGIDPYTRAVSDVYQDLFGEGSFFGKGIYAIDAFEAALAGRLPDNRILSHDLLEGCYARAGLVSDVQLYEDHPARYAADVARRHRWIRGDWQLLPWLLPRVPTPGGSYERNPLSLLSRAKVLDNLRRSLVPVALTSLLVLGWIFAISPLSWTIRVLAIVFLPPLIAAGADLFDRPPDLALSSHLQDAIASIGRGLTRALLYLACLPYEAFFSLDAVLRTLWRMLVSHRHMLEWRTSGDVDGTLRNTLSESMRTMAFAPLAALAALLLLVHLRPDALWVAAPILLLWSSAPILMWRLGWTRSPNQHPLGAAERRYLGRLARRTWAYFENFSTEADHWLPPDNVQEHPALMVAHRTSPTNIGLGLLADLAAYDFGYLSGGALCTRTANVLRTLESMPRYRGHYYNWYDTLTLKPLPPHYVSAVDSGNLAGHLLTLRQGLLALREAPIIATNVFRGLADTLGLALEEDTTAAGRTEAIALENLLSTAVAAHPSTLAEAVALLLECRLHATALHEALGTRSDRQRAWTTALIRQSQDALDDAAQLMPAADSGNESGSAAGTAPIPTVREVATSTTPDGSGPRTAAARAARARITEFERLAHAAAQCAQMDQEFLYDRARRLLAIGYNVDERRLDPGYYDLLASEARLCAFVGIAQGQLPQECWFALGRLLTDVGGEPTLLSWSGSMFEYLMPQLVMPSYEDTLLDQTAQHAVSRQIAYGRQRDVPWGISESGYNAVDAQMNYQYRAFGVPGLGLKRGLGQDLVIAPYATLLALLVAPEAACHNLHRMSDAGFSGHYGMYEAIDYTSERLPRGHAHALIRSYMSHHQGMGLLALDHVLNDRPMQKRFADDPQFKATLLLLQERIPRTGVFHPHAAEDLASSARRDVDDGQLRIFRTPDTARPAVQMLTNSRYHVMLTSAGGGYSRLADMATTRWREDVTRDHYGTFCYLRDVTSGEFWSAAHQPAVVAVQDYEAIFSDAKAEFRGRKRGFDTHLEIAVSPEDDIELRRLRITNRSRHARTIEITTYAEVVLASAIADELHPAFSNLFVQTELVRAKQAIVCTRRPRSRDETPPWMFHLMAVHDGDVDTISYESDRARFIGRGNTTRNPDALTRDVQLSNTAGSVLDPVVAIRSRMTLEAGKTVTVDMVFGVSGTRVGCDEMIDKYRDRRIADRVFDLAWTHSEVVRRQINASQTDAQLYERIAGLIVFAHAALRAEPSVLLQNRRGQSSLWGHAISGDHPIVLVRIADASNLELVRQMVQAHAYWRLKGLTVDLVIWNEDQAGYRQQLHDQIMGLVAAGVEAHAIDRPGGIFVRPGQQMSHDDRVLLQSVARVIVSDSNGSLAEQVSRRGAPSAPIPAFVAESGTVEGDFLPAENAGTANGAIASAVTSRSPDNLPIPVSPNPGAPAVSITAPDGPLFNNGRGGFSANGREYIVTLDKGDVTPAPWSNVLANSGFGCVVTDSTVGYTWSENAHEFRLTPWYDDPVTDESGEAFYLRDEASGHVWSPTPFPVRASGRYRVRHGFGYSVYECTERGIASSLKLFVDVVEPVKYAVLTLHNTTNRTRRISVTGYVDWILGDLHAKTQMHVVTDYDEAGHCITATNNYNTEFDQRSGFLAVDTPHVNGSSIGVTADRMEFLGRNGSLRHPAAMSQQRLAGKFGAGLDPCAALQLPVDLAGDESVEIVFRLGAGRTREDALAVEARTRGPLAAEAAYAAVEHYWATTLGVVQVTTPDPAVDVLANGWLLYQTIACRYFARSGYYQSGGAIGFRDQLQDTMALLHAAPRQARAHLLLCAAHQFPEGDVLHWWHPPVDRGVRTRCSDDYLWLAWCTARYVDLTGDATVLDESAPYIDGRQLHAGEESDYDLPGRSDLSETLYQHCLRAIGRALPLIGKRGLPLMGSGDWNDGMNRVGDKGLGESVWLGFFLYDTLRRFAKLAQARNDASVVAQYSAAAAALQQNLEQHGWDGAWYRRAWFDNGAPLGSVDSDECRIDSIAQSWATLSGAAEPGRARKALDSLDRHLVRRAPGLVQLLDPPFDHTTQDPGYIMGYVPGVRENGGQYTHAAIWAAMAFAEIGDAPRAWELMRMINPINHALTPSASATYAVEPYVTAADVYAVPPHTGRGGWTWYTGSAGWMYRLMIETLLGVNRQGSRLEIRPCIPIDWPGYEVRYRCGSALYRIAVRQDASATMASVVVDGTAQLNGSFALVDDGREHDVAIVVAPRAS